MRAIFPLLLAVSLPLSAAPLHSQFLPADDLSLRQQAPTAQQLLQVTDYSVVVGTQRQSDQQPIPITASLQMRLKGKPMNKGATIAQVLLNFDGEGGKSLKKPVFDDKTRTLTLNYPMADYRVIMDLLRNETLYVQFLSYPNGHIWADLHTGTVRTR
ncbi:hypothetical protein KSS93_25465 [Pseudomonas xanthosomatis]|uniref:hypothetical protein n=1 Tax=Pseudomonas xanthosomatis TaxID=2842356 RepID=UPI001C3C37DE|nr:hypothetical protein [Pseudomonas xanthosomatis]QXH46173.1 hypothetical protein KSS93_25465 [Pseudomonas xanthosomatis]